MFVMIDLDNTLADRDRAVRAWIREFCTRHDLDDDAAPWLHEADNDGYSPRHQVLEAARRRFRLPDPVDVLLADYQQRAVELVQPTDGALQCLIDLRRTGWTIAIVSNGSSKQQHAKIKRLGLDALVDVVCISGDLDIKKPDPAIFEAAAAMAGALLQGAWMVGDSAHHDIVGAQRLGLSTAWLHRGRPWDGTLPTPDLTLGSMSHLVAGLSGQR